MLIGYARVSTKSQNLDRQLALLEAAGCEHIVTEKASGKNTTGRPVLNQTILALEKDDVLVVAEWDRATRSMDDGIQILAKIHARGASVKALDRTWLDLTTPVGKGILAFLSALAEDDRDRILKRAEQGRDAAQRAGVRFGRPPALTGRRLAEAKEMIGEGLTDRKIASRLGVSHSTIGRLRRSLAEPV